MVVSKLFILLCYSASLVCLNKADQYPSYIDDPNAPQCVKDKWDSIDKERWFNCTHNGWILTSFDDKDTKKRIVCCYVSGLDKCREGVFGKYCAGEGIAFYHKWKQPWDKVYPDSEFSQIYKDGCTGYDFGSAKCNAGSLKSPTKLCLIFSINLLIILGVMRKL